MISPIMALTFCYALSAAIGDEPRPPVAVRTSPDWLKDAPFDVEKFFAMPPDSENAAPLYLDAFFEFGPEVAASFPLDQRDRADIARERYRRVESIYWTWDKDAKSVATDQIDALVAEFDEGFRKLDLAQRRPQCVFAAGLIEDGIPPHAQVARTVSRVLRLRAERSLDRGDFESAFADIQRLLRISRDVRPRGGVFSQLVGSSIDFTACNHVVVSLLNRPRLSVDHCDRLLKLLIEHDVQMIDSYAEGIKSQFVLDRFLTRMLAEGIKTTIDAEGRLVETKLDRQGILRELIPRILASAVADKLVDERGPRPFDGLGSKFTAASVANQMIVDAEKDPHWGDRLTRSLLTAKATYPDRIGVLLESKRRKSTSNPPAWFRLVAEKYETLIQSWSRDEIYRGSTRCLVALKRWQLTQEVAPTDLAEVCRAAGMSRVPLDPFSGSIMKMTVLDGEAVVYSVGEDGKDDRALKNADLGRKPGAKGDYLFRMNKQKL